MMGSYWCESQNAERKTISRKPICRIPSFNLGADKNTKMNKIPPSFYRDAITTTNPTSAGVNYPMRDIFRIYSCSPPTAENARRIAYAIKRYIIETKEQVKRTSNFVKRTHSKIVDVHNYNCKVAENIGIYPLDDDLKQLLIIYIELELSILRNPDYNTDTYRLTLEMRLLTLLSTIYSKYCDYTSGRCNPSVTWHLILELFDRVPYDVHMFFEDIRQKVVDKIDFGQDKELLRSDSILEKSQVTCYKELDGSVEVELNQDNDPLLRCCETFNILPEVETSRPPLECANEVISDDEITDTGQLNDDVKPNRESMFLPSLTEQPNSLKHSTMLKEYVKPEIIDLCDDETPQHTGRITKRFLPRNSMINLVDSSDDEDSRNTGVQKSSADSLKCDKNVDSVIKISEDSFRNENVINSLSRTESDKSNEVSIIESSKSGHNGGTFRTQDEAEILRQIRQSGASEVIIVMVNNKLVISPKNNLNLTDVNINTKNQDIVQISQSSPKSVESKHVQTNVLNSTVIDLCTDSSTNLERLSDKDCRKFVTFSDSVPSSKSPVSSQIEVCDSEITSNANFQEISTSLTQKHDLSNPQTIVIYKSSFDSESSWASCESFRSIYELENEVRKSPEFISAPNIATSGTRSSCSDGTEKKDPLEHSASSVEEFERIGAAAFVSDNRERSCLTAESDPTSNEKNVLPIWSSDSSEDTSDIDENILLADDEEENDSNSDQDIRLRHRNNCRLPTPRNDSSDNLYKYKNIQRRPDDFSTCQSSIRDSSSDRQQTAKDKILVVPDAVYQKSSNTTLLHSNQMTTANQVGESTALTLKIEKCASDVTAEECISNNECTPRDELYELSEEEKKKEPHKKQPRKIADAYISEVVGIDNTSIFHADFPLKEAQGNTIRRPCDLESTGNNSLDEQSESTESKIEKELPESSKGSLLLDQQLNESSENQTISLRTYKMTANEEQIVNLNVTFQEDHKKNCIQEKNHETIEKNELHSETTEKRVGITFDDRPVKIQDGHEKGKILNENTAISLEYHIQENIREHPVGKIEITAETETLSHKLDLSVRIEDEHVGKDATTSLVDDKLINEQKTNENENNIDESNTNIIENEKSIEEDRLKYNMLENVAEKIVRENEITTKAEDVRVHLSVRSQECTKDRTQEEHLGTIKTTDFHTDTSEIELNTGIVTELSKEQNIIQNEKSVHENNENALRDNTIENMEGSPVNEDEILTEAEDLLKKAHQINLSVETHEECNKNCTQEKHLEAPKENNFQCDTTEEELIKEPKSNEKEESNEKLGYNTLETIKAHLDENNEIPTEAEKFPKKVNQSFGSQDECTENCTQEKHLETTKENDFHSGIEGNLEKIYDLPTEAEALLKNVDLNLGSQEEYAKNCTFETHLETTKENDFFKDSSEKGLEESLINDGLITHKNNESLDEHVGRKLDYKKLENIKGNPMEKDEIAPGAEALSQKNILSDRIQEELIENYTQEETIETTDKNELLNDSIQKELNTALDDVELVKKQKIKHNDINIDGSVENESKEDKGRNEQEEEEVSGTSDILKCVSHTIDDQISIKGTVTSETECYSGSEDSSDSKHDNEQIIETEYVIEHNAVYLDEYSIDNIVEISSCDLNAQNNEIEHRNIEDIDSDASGKQDVLNNDPLADEHQCAISIKEQSTETLPDVENINAEFSEEDSLKFCDHQAANVDTEISNMEEKHVEETITKAVTQFDENISGNKTMIKENQPVSPTEDVENTNSSVFLEQSENEVDSKNIELEDESNQHECSISNEIELGNLDIDESQSTAVENNIEKHENHTLADSNMFKEPNPTLRKQNTQENGKKADDAEALKKLETHGASLKEPELEETLSKDDRIFGELPLEIYSKMPTANIREFSSVVHEEAPENHGNTTILALNSGKACAGHEIILEKINDNTNQSKGISMDLDRNIKKEILESIIEALEESDSVPSDSLDFNDAEESPSSSPSANSDLIKDNEDSKKWGGVLPVEEPSTFIDGNQDPNRGSLPESDALGVTNEVNNSKESAIVDQHKDVSQSSEKVRDDTAETINSFNNLKDDEFHLYMPEPIKYTQEQIRHLTSEETKARDDPLKFLDAVKNNEPTQDDEVLNLTSTKRPHSEKNNDIAKDIGHDLEAVELLSSFISKVNDVEIVKSRTSQHCVGGISESSDSMRDKNGDASKGLNLSTNNNFGEKKVSINQNSSERVVHASESKMGEQVHQESVESKNNDDCEVVTKMQLKPSDIPMPESFAAYLPKNGEKVEVSAPICNTYEESLQDLRHSLSKFGTEVIQKANDSEDLHFSTYEQESDSEELLIDEDSCLRQEYLDVQSEVILGPQVTHVDSNDLILHISNNYQTLLSKGNHKKIKTAKSFKNSITLYKGDTEDLYANSVIYSNASENKFKSLVQEYLEENKKPQRRKPNILKRRTRNNPPNVEKKPYLQPKLTVISNEPKASRPKTKAEIKQMPTEDAYQSTLSESDDDLPLAERVKPRTPSPKKKKTRYGTTGILIGKQKNGELHKEAPKRTRGKSGERAKNSLETAIVLDVSTTEEVVVKHANNKPLSKAKELLKENQGKRIRRKSGELYEETEKTSVPLKNRRKSGEYDKSNNHPVYPKPWSQSVEMPHEIIKNKDVRTYRSKLRPRSCSGSEMALDNPSSPAVDAVLQVTDPVSSLTEGKALDTLASDHSKRSKPGDKLKCRKGTTFFDVPDLIDVDKSPLTSSDITDNYTSKLRRKSTQDYTLDLSTSVEASSLDTENYAKNVKKLSSASPRSKSIIPADEKNVLPPVKASVGRGRGRKFTKSVNATHLEPKVSCRGRKPKKLKVDEQPAVGDILINPQSIPSFENDILYRKLENVSPLHKPVKKPNLKLYITQKIKEPTSPTRVNVRTPSEIKKNVQNSPSSTPITAGTPKERGKREFKAQIEKAKIEVTPKDLDTGLMISEQTTERHVHSEENLPLDCSNTAPEVADIKKVVPPKLSLFSHCKNHVKSTAEKLSNRLQIDLSSMEVENEREQKESAISQTESELILVEKKNSQNLVQSTVSIDKAQISVENKDIHAVVHNHVHNHGIEVLSASQQTCAIIDHFGSNVTPRNSELMPEKKYESHFVNDSAMPINLTLINTSNESEFDGIQSEYNFLSKSAVQNGEMQSSKTEYAESTSLTPINDEPSLNSTIHPVPENINTNDGIKQVAYTKVTSVQPLKILDESVDTPLKDTTEIETTSAHQCLKIDQTNVPILSLKEKIETKDLLPPQPHKDDSFTKNSDDISGDNISNEEHNGEILSLQSEDQKKTSENNLSQCSQSRAHLVEESLNADNVVGEIGNNVREIPIETTERHSSDVSDENVDVASKDFTQDNLASSNFEVIGEIISENPNSLLDYESEQTEVIYSELFEKNEKEVCLAQTIEINEEINDGDLSETALKTDKIEEQSEIIATVVTSDYERQSVLLLNSGENNSEVELPNSEQSMPFAAEQIVESIAQKSSSEFMAPQDHTKKDVPSNDIIDEVTETKEITDDVLSDEDGPRSRSDYLIDQRHDVLSNDEIDEVIETKEITKDVQSDEDGPISRSDYKIDQRHNVHSNDKIDDVIEANEISKDVLSDEDGPRSRSDYMIDQKHNVPSNDKIDEVIETKEMTQDVLSDEDGPRSRSDYMIDQKHNVPSNDKIDEVIETKEMTQDVLSDEDGPRSRSDYMIDQKHNVPSNDKIDEVIETKEMTQDVLSDEDGPRSRSDYMIDQKHNVPSNDKIDEVIEKKEMTQDVLSDEDGPRSRSDYMIVQKHNVPSNDKIDEVIETKETKNVLCDEAGPRSSIEYAIDKRHNIPSNDQLDEVNETKEITKDVLSDEDGQRSRSDYMIDQRHNSDEDIDMAQIEASAVDQDIISNNHSSVVHYNNIVLPRSMDVELENPKNESILPEITCAGSSEQILEEGNNETDVELEDDGNCAWFIEEQIVETTITTDLAEELNEETQGRVVERSVSLNEHPVTSGHTSTSIQKSNTQLKYAEISTSEQILENEQEENLANRTSDSNDLDLVSIAQEAAKQACENFEDQSSYFDDTKSLIKQDLDSSIGNDVKLTDTSSADVAKEKIQDKLRHLLQDNAGVEIHGSSGERKQIAREKKSTAEVIVSEKNSLNDGKKQESKKDGTYKSSKAREKNETDRFKNCRNECSSKKDKASRSSENPKDSSTSSLRTDSDSEVEIRSKYSSRSKIREKSSRHSEYRQNEKSKPLTEPEKRKSLYDSYRTRDDKYQNEKRSTRSDTSRSIKHRSGSSSSMNSASSSSNISGRDRDSDRTNYKTSRSSDRESYRNHDKYKYDRNRKDSDTKSGNRKVKKEEQYKSERGKEVKHEKSRKDTFKSNEKSHRDYDERKSYSKTGRTETRKYERRNEKEHNKDVDEKRDEKRESTSTGSRGKIYKKECNNDKYIKDDRKKENLKTSQQKIVAQKDKRSNKRQTNHSKKFDELVIKLDRESIYKTISSKVKDPPSERTKQYLGMAPVNKDNAEQFSSEPSGSEKKNSTMHQEISRKENGVQINEKTLKNHEASVEKSKEIKNNDFEHTKKNKFVDRIAPTEEKIHSDNLRGTLQDGEVCITSVNEITENYIVHSIDPDNISKKRKSDDDEDCIIETTPERPKKKKIRYNTTTQRSLNERITLAADATQHIDEELKENGCVKSTSILEKAGLSQVDKKTIISNSTCEELVESQDFPEIERNSNNSPEITDDKLSQEVPVETETQSNKEPELEIELHVPAIPEESIIVPQPVYSRIALKKEIETNVPSMEISKEIEKMEYTEDIVRDSELFRNEETDSAKNAETILSEDFSKDYITEHKDCIELHSNQLMNVVHFPSEVISHSEVLTKEDKDISKENNDVVSEYEDCLELHSDYQSGPSMKNSKEIQEMESTEHIVLNSEVFSNEERDTSKNAETPLSVDVSRECITEYKEGIEPHSNQKINVEHFPSEVISHSEVLTKKDKDISKDNNDVVSEHEDCLEMHSDHQSDPSMKNSKEIQEMESTEDIVLNSEVFSNEEKDSAKNAETALYVDVSREYISQHEEGIELNSNQKLNVEHSSSKIIPQSEVSTKEDEDISKDHNHVVSGHEDCFEMHSDHQSHPSMENSKEIQEMESTEDIVLNSEGFSNEERDSSKNAETPLSVDVSRECITEYKEGIELNSNKKTNISHSPSEIISQSEVLTKEDEDISKDNNDAVSDRENCFEMHSDHQSNPSTEDTVLNSEVFRSEERCSSKNAQTILSGNKEYITECIELHSNQQINMAYSPSEVISHTKDSSEQDEDTSKDNKLIEMHSDEQIKEATFPMDIDNQQAKINTPQELELPVGSHDLKNSECTVPRVVTEPVAQPLEDENKSDINPCETYSSEQLFDEALPEVMNKLRDSKEVLETQSVQTEAVQVLDKEQTNTKNPIKYYSSSSGLDMSGSATKSETKLRQNRLSVEQKSVEITIKKRKKSTEDEVPPPPHVTADTGEGDTDFSMHSNKVSKTLAGTDIRSIKDVISKPEVVSKVNCKYSAIMLESLSTDEQDKDVPPSDLRNNQELLEKVTTSANNSVARNEESEKISEVNNLCTDSCSKKLQFNTSLLKSSFSTDTQDASLQNTKSSKQPDDILNDDVAFFELSLVTDITGSSDNLLAYPSTSSKNTNIREKVYQHVPLQVLKGDMEDCPNLHKSLETSIETSIGGLLKQDEPRKLKQGKLEMLERNVSSKDVFHPKMSSPKNLEIPLTVSNMLSDAQVAVEHKQNSGGSIHFNRSSDGIQDLYKQIPDYFRNPSPPVPTTRVATLEGRNPSPPTTSPVDICHELDPYKIDSDTQRPQILPDFVDNKDAVNDLLDGSRNLRQSNISAPATSLSVIPNSVPTTLQNSMVNFQHIFGNSFQDNTVPNINTQFSNSKRDSSKFVDPLSANFHSQSSINISSGHISDVPTNLPPGNTHSAQPLPNYMQGLEASSFLEIKTEKETELTRSDEHATVLSGDVEFLEEYPCTSPENVLPNYKNETIKASPPTSSISQHSENTRDNVDMNTSDNSFQKGDHTYIKDPLINGQTKQKKESPEYTGEYGKPITEFDMDELLDFSRIDESSTPASVIFCSSSAMNSDVGWAFNVEPANSNEIPSWDENTKVIVEPQPQTCYPDFSCLTMSCDMTDLSQGSDSSVTSLDKGNIDLTDWLNLSNTPELPGKKLREIMTEQIQKDFSKEIPKVGCPTNDDIKIPKGVEKKAGKREEKKISPKPEAKKVVKLEKKKPELLVVPTRKHGRTKVAATRKSTPILKTEKEKPLEIITTSNEPYLDIPKKQELKSNDLVENNELPLLVPLSRVTTRSSSKKDTIDSYVTPQSQSLYNSKSKLLENLESENSRSSTSNVTISNKSSVVSNKSGTLFTVESLLKTNVSQPTVVTRSIQMQNVNVSDINVVSSQGMIHPSPPKDVFQPSGLSARCSGILPRDTSTQKQVTLNARDLKGKTVRLQVVNPTFLYINVKKEPVEVKNAPPLVALQSDQQPKSPSNKSMEASVKLQEPLKNAGDAIVKKGLAVESHKKSPLPKPSEVVKVTNKKASNSPLSDNSLVCESRLRTRIYNEVLNQSLKRSNEEERGNEEKKPRKSSTAIDPFDKLLKSPVSPMFKSHDLQLKDNSRRDTRAQHSRNSHLSNAQHVKRSVPKVPKEPARHVRSNDLRSHTEKQSSPFAERSRNNSQVSGSSKSARASPTFNRSEGDRKYTSSNAGNRSDPGRYNDVKGTSPMQSLFPDPSSRSPDGSSGVVKETDWLERIATKVDQEDLALSSQIHLYSGSTTSK